MRSTLFILLAVTACSSGKSASELRKAIARAWKGRPVAELKDNPYLKGLKRYDGEGQIIFSKDGRFPSRARCGALGGCMGTSVGVGFGGGGMGFGMGMGVGGSGQGGCDHLFGVKEGLIQDYSAGGACREEMKELLKKSP